MAKIFKKSTNLHSLGESSFQIFCTENFNKVKSNVIFDLTTSFVLCKPIYDDAMG